MKTVEVDETRCDGCGLCVSACAEGALVVVDGKARLNGQATCDGLGACVGVCPRGALRVAEETVRPTLPSQDPNKPRARRQWPFKLRLLNPSAPLLKGADLLVLADCAAIAADDVRGDVVRGRVVAMGCPKSDDLDAYVDRLAAIITEARVSSLSVAVMDVPCCQGLVFVAQEAARLAGWEASIERMTVSRSGDVTFGGTGA